MSTRICMVFVLWSTLAFVLEPTVRSPTAVLADEEGATSPVPVGVPAEDLPAEVAELEQQLQMLEASGVGRGDELAYESACPGWLGSVDYLNWDLHGRGTDFAVATDDSALAIGRGSVQRLEMDRNSGVRGNFGCRLARGWELTAGYTYFRTSATASAVEPVGGAMWATRSHANRNELATTADASSSFNLNVFDLEARSPRLQSCPVVIQWFGGLRWTDIGQDFQVLYDGADFDNGVYRQTMDSTGFGLRLGAQVDWSWCSHWSLFGSAAGSLLYGRFSSHFLETNVSSQDAVVDVQDDYGQGVPLIETSIGVARNCGPMAFRAGYEMSNWFNLQDRANFPDNVHEGVYVPLSSDILLEGLFLRLSCSY